MFRLLASVLLLTVVSFAEGDRETVNCSLIQELSNVSSFEFPPTEMPSKAESHESIPAEAVVAPVPQERFDTRAALQQYGRLLLFQQGIMLSSDKWGRHELTHGKWLKKYNAALRGTFTQWDDGDPFLDNYIGHPFQGAISGFVAVQNHPRNKALRFENNGRYWRSRLNAMAWSAAYSTQFEIGPLSEASIQKLGSYEYQNCPTCPVVNGAGWVDLVVTPTLGTAWLVGEDALDRYLVERWERRRGNGVATRILRSVLNPARTAANLLRFKAPWHRDRPPAWTNPSPPFARSDTRLRAAQNQLK